MAAIKWDVSGAIDVNFPLLAYLLNIKELYPHQKAALKEFFSGNNLYFSAATGSGKSLIFQCITVVIDLIKDQAIGTSTALVISPLNALMLDQIEKLKKTAISGAAVYANQSKDVLMDIERGEYSLVYTSPESMLASDRWRTILSSKHYRENCEVVIIDEAHCIVHWGTSNGSTNDVPFRGWYSKLPELKVLPQNPRIAIFTTTASKSTKRRSFEILGVSLLNTHVIQHEPIKNNLRFAVQYVERDQSLEKTFAFLISELKSNGIKTSGTLIFCRTRKQCAAIYKVLQLNLGNKIYTGQIDSPKERIIEMYHAGTPESVKHHILSTLTKENGHIRALVCTVAFAMGIDCQYITRVVHFGGSKCIESYVQECGRAGRRGEVSLCILLYNGILLQHSDDDIKNYAASKTCRRVEMRHSFPEAKTCDTVLGCHCCDKCATDCSLPHDNCCKNIFRQFQESFDVLEQLTRTRPVSQESKMQLREMLGSYRVSLLPEPQSAHFVAYPNMLFEFNRLQISQAVNSCHKIFSIEDVKKFVEI